MPLVAVFLPREVVAQSTDLLLVEACRENPHAEECVCASVPHFGSYPKQYGLNGVALDTDFDGEVPVYNPQTGFWEGDHADLEFFNNDNYQEQCALSYFRENLRRLWYFAAFVGAGFVGISLTWGGVVWMQDSSSGVDLSRARGMIVRVLLGLIILTCAYLIWEGLSDFLLNFMDSWSMERTDLYQFR